MVTRDLQLKTYLGHQLGMLKVKPWHSTDRCNWGKRGWIYSVQRVVIQKFYSLATVDWLGIKRFWTSSHLFSFLLALFPSLLPREVRATAAGTRVQLTAWGLGDQRSKTTTLSHNQKVWVWSTGLVIPLVSVERTQNMGRRAVDPSCLSLSPEREGKSQLWRESEHWDAS